MSERDTTAATAAAAAATPRPEDENADVASGAAAPGSAAPEDEASSVAAAADGGDGTDTTATEEKTAEGSRKVVRGPGQNNIELVMRIPVKVEVVLGTARMTIAELMQLGPGAVVQLDRHVGEPIDVMVNGRLVARGEVVVDENDETRLGIRLTEIVEPGTFC
jgi:flagellar motor switch protein FliN/FliY